MHSHDYYFLGYWSNVDFDSGCRNFYSSHIEIESWLLGVCESHGGKSHGGESHGGKSHGSISYGNSSLGGGCQLIGQVIVWSKSENVSE